jgi:hypothetical protein
METVTVSILKKELKLHSQQELIEICLKLAKFKKENKELLTYVLFDSNDEDEYIRGIKEAIDLEFSNLNHYSFYFVKKSTRKILRSIKKHIRYSKKKETEAVILLYFCNKLRQLNLVNSQSQQMTSIYEQQLKMVRKAISTLHEDLQYDLNLELEKLDAKHE